MLKGAIVHFLSIWWIICFKRLHSLICDNWMYRTWLIMKTYEKKSCLGKLSLSAKSTLEKPILDILPCVNLKIVFRSGNRLSSKFNFKDKMWKAMHSLLCYKFQCTSCNATYYSKPKCYFKFHVFEHIGVSACTGQNIRSTKNCVIICCVWSYANL